MLRNLTIRNLLSYGPDNPALELGSLNLLIGPNGSGKSNLIEALYVLTSSPKQLAAPIKESGGIRQWLWKNHNEASIRAEWEMPEKNITLRHSLVFGMHGERFELVDESVDNLTLTPNHPAFFYYRHGGGQPALAVKGETRYLQRENLNPEQSVLAQIRDPELYPELTFLQRKYDSARFYREWSFGRRSPLRTPQPTDLPTDYLMESGENLALVLNKIRPRAKTRLLQALDPLFPGIEDFNVQLESGLAQLFLEENGQIIPASRLSDGTLRFLYLLAVLCHPEPPPLVVIEEPELGLHPDVIPEIARLLTEAAERTQLIVTTHSDALVDAFSEQPELVVVCERPKDRTILQRLDRANLDEWLKKYSLGQLWLRGEIGGKRW